MIQIKKAVFPSPEQWEMIIEGMRNPMNSWAQSDSHKTHIEDAETLETADFEFFMGEKDHDLAMRLRNAGTDHRKFMRMIPVYLTINAPLYWWKEFDTYKVGTVANSCSTMHKIHSKEFTLLDFSTEYLCDYVSGEYHSVKGCDAYETYNATPLACMKLVVNTLNGLRLKYIHTKDKQYWDNMIQLLPSSYNQQRTVLLNYEVLANMYKSRKNHKLAEWRNFCKWIETIEYSEFITGGDNVEI